MLHNLLLAFVAAVAALGGYWAGWQGRAIHEAARDAIAAREAAQGALAAEERLNNALLKAREEIAVAYEAAAEAKRERDRAQRVVTVTKIREIYRDRPAPPAADCAAPDAARRLLIDLGASGPADAYRDPGPAAGKL